MRRILGLDQHGVWHIAASTYTATMHTKCDKWLRVKMFALERTALSDGRAAEVNCATCTYVKAVDFNPRDA